MESFKSIEFGGTDSERIEWRNKRFELHKIGGPAIIYINGDEEWFVNGNPHREDGPAIIRDGGKHKEWWINGERHRENGPALIDKYGNMAWLQHDKGHREDGPALIRKDGKKEYYINGEYYTEKKYNEIMFNKNLEKLNENE